MPKNKDLIFNPIVHVSKKTKINKDADLFKYVEENNLDEIKELIENGTNPAAGDSEGKTALHIAAEMGCFDIVKYLIDLDNNLLNIQDRFGKVPLHIALENLEIEIANYILTKESDIDVQEQEGQTPLHFALFYKELGIAKTLIDKAAKTDIVDEYGKIASDFELYHEIIKDSPVKLDDCFTTNSEGSNSQDQINCKTDVTGDIIVPICYSIEG